MEKLTDVQIQQFIDDGFIKVENAFPRELAEEGLPFLWKDTGCDPDDPATWTQPVIRLGGYDQEPFSKAVNTPLLLTAFDQLAGKGNWVPRYSLGAFVIRFPSDKEPNDTGWHVDTSFPGEGAGNDYFKWRANIKSKGKALLMLFLFSDTGEQDAPTRIRVGSHLDVARLLMPAGEEGLSTLQIPQKLADSASGPEALATGKAGTVYLCHPFLLHAAQPNYGKRPRFLAQPPLIASEFDVFRQDDHFSPVETAIRNGLGLD